MFSSSNVYQQQIHSMFSRRDSKELDFIFKVVDLIVYQNMNSSDLFELYSVVDLETFSKIVNIVDGRNIKIPKKSELEDAFLTALFYFEREIKGLEWEAIKAKYPEIQVSSLKYSTRIRNLDNFVKQKIVEAFKDS